MSFAADLKKVINSATEPEPEILRQLGKATASKKISVYQEVSRGATDRPDQYLNLSLLVPFGLTVGEITEIKYVGNDRSDITFRATVSKNNKVWGKEVTQLYRQFDCDAVYSDTLDPYKVMRLTPVRWNKRGVLVEIDLMILDRD